MRLLIGSQGAGVPPPPLILNNFTVTMAKVNPNSKDKQEKTNNDRAAEGYNGAHFVPRLAQIMAAGINTITEPGKIIIALRIPMQTI